MPEDLPRRRITKKTCHVDEDGVEEFVGFLRVLADVVAVIRVAAQIELKHAPAEAPFEGGIFIAAEVESSLFRELLQQLL